MKKTILITLFLFLFAPVAFASNESIDALIAELEGKDPQVVAEEKAAERTAEEKKKEFEELKKRLRITQDKITGNKRVQSNKTPRWSETTQDISFYLEAIDHSEGVGLWYICGYYKTPIIFMEGVIMNVDGEIYDWYFSPPTEKPRRGREYVKRIAIAPYLDIFYKISQSKKTLVRFNGGRGSVEFEVTKNQKEALYDIWFYGKYRRDERGLKY